MLLHLSRAKLSTPQGAGPTSDRGLASDRSDIDAGPSDPERLKVAGRGASADEDEMSFLKDFWRYMKARRKFWLLPVFICMFLLGGLLILSKGSAVAPFIYTLF